jgi:hypothetical protein
MYTFTNANDGICATVTKVAKGYAVSLLDTDVEEGLIEGRVYPEDRLEDAVEYALAFILGKTPISINVFL